MKLVFCHLVRKYQELCLLYWFEHFTLNVLSTFASGIYDVFQNLVRPPPTLTGKKYEVLGRVLLGFQAVVIFGVKAITPSIKQVVVYVPYYIYKAREDGKTIGLPLTWGNISDATMETAHKLPKQGNIHLLVEGMGQ